MVERIGVGGDKWHQVRVAYPMMLPQLIGYLWAGGMHAFRLGMGDGPGMGPFLFSEYPSGAPFAPLTPPCALSHSWSWIQVAEPSTPFGPQQGWLYGDCNEVLAWSMYLAGKGGLLSPREYLVTAL